jgi:hypothetical protein
MKAATGGVQEQPVAYLESRRIARAVLGESGPLLAEIQSSGSRSAMGTR